MPQVTVYTRDGCHLCDDAIDTIDDVAESIPTDVELSLIDVDDDPKLREAYGERVPYVFVDGTPRFKYRVDESELRNYLEQADD